MRPEEELDLFFDEQNYIRAAKRHPERIDSIIADAERLNASDYTLTQLTLCRYDLKKGVKNENISIAQHL